MCNLKGQGHVQALCDERPSLQSQGFRVLEHDSKGLWETLQVCVIYCVVVVSGSGTSRWLEGAV